MMRYSLASAVVPFSFLLLIAGAELRAQQKQHDIRTGVYHGQPITFEVIHGWAVVEGDIIIGRAEDLQNPAAKTQSRSGRDRARPNAVSIPPIAADLWPKVNGVYQVPYINDHPENTAINMAVNLFNNTFPNVIQYVSRDTTNPQPDYVEFNVTVPQPDANGNLTCESQSAVGRTGGAQQISGSSNCVSVLIHEMGHSIGLFHEQERSDRNGFVAVQFSNLDPANRSNYDGAVGSQNLGLYDLGSTMHYGSGTFAADTTDVTMESIPVGIPFKEGGGYSAGDIDAIRRLYGATATAVTITTNPTGLQVAVDGKMITSGTAAATFNWNIGDTHTLDVPDSIKTQTLNGTTYVFGRWNDITPDKPANHTITISAGDGSPSYPTNTPRITVYSASFRQMVPSAGLITTGVSPQGAGTVTLSPNPVSIQNTTYYYLLDHLNATAAPAAGYSFYDWQFDSNALGIMCPNPLPPTPWCGPSSGPNPRVVRPTITSNVTARFAQNPVTTVTTNPPDLPITVDGTSYMSPKNFAQDYDMAWTQGSSHAIAVNSPLTSNIEDPKARLAFMGWSDNGTQTHNITAGAAATYTANFVVQFALNVTMPGPQDNMGNTCSVASVTATPPSTDTYYNVGTQVSLAVQPNAGWNFIGWQGDLTGTANPGILTVNATKNVQALFNTANAPLTITGLAPAAGSLNGQAFTLTVNGTGFSGNPITTYCFFPPGGGGNSLVCGNTTFVNPNMVTVPVTPDLLMTAQTLGLTLYNGPAGSTCQVSAATTLPVQ